MSSHPCFHSFSEILDHLYYYYSESLFRQIASLYLSLSCFSGVSSGFCIWNLFLSYFILSNYPYLWSLFLRLQNWSSCFWCLSPGRWGWSRGLCRLSSARNRHLPTGGWSWVLSLWWAGPCQVSRGSCGLRKTLGSLFVDRWNCVPNLLVVWPETFQHWSLQAIGWVMEASRRAHTKEYSLGTPVSVPLQWTTANPEETL